MSSVVTPSSNMFNQLENNPGESSPQPIARTDQDVQMSEVGINENENQGEHPPADRFGGEWSLVKKKKNKSRTAEDAGLENTSAPKTPRVNNESPGNPVNNPMSANAGAGGAGDSLNPNGAANPSPNVGPQADGPQVTPANTQSGGAGPSPATSAAQQGGTPTGTTPAQQGPTVPPAPTQQQNVPPQPVPNANANAQGGAGNQPPPPLPPAQQPAQQQQQPNGPNAPPQAPPQAGVVGTPAPYPFLPHEGRRAAHEQVPRSEFGCSTWPGAHVPTHLPGEASLLFGVPADQAQAWRTNTSVFVYPECADHTSMTPAVFCDIVSKYSAKFFPGDPPLRAVPASPNPLLGPNYRSKTGFVAGTAAQIAWVKSQVVMSTSGGCLIARPIGALPSRLIVTVGGLLFTADRIGELHTRVAHVVYTCEELRILLANPIYDLIPAHVVDKRAWLLNTIELVPVEAVEPGTRAPVIWWHILSDVPSSDPDAHMTFRKVFAKHVKISTPFDGYSEPLPRPFKCSICRSIFHPQGMCPLPARPEWYGFVPRMRGIAPVEEVKDEDEPVLADADEPAPKDSTLPKPTMPKNWGEKGAKSGNGGKSGGNGKGKGKGKGKA
ncbi:hypothetical protein EXIGLDRAFT_781480 [Exidia glandulosa HHB12029]|uniref:Uncharacterized protein n=1 Tax=Exidia glandulosa HHB12029 TaxID=1314781 RepID=A0A165B8D9_EXIGL|nr:hypothetical protein EXIGLDRAFT_781480 [Exidia glandulosa HHB12029]